MSANTAGPQKRRIRKADEMIVRLSSRPSKGKGNSPLDSSPDTHFCALSLRTPFRHIPRYYPSRLLSQSFAHSQQFGMVLVSTNPITLSHLPCVCVERNFARFGRLPQPTFNVSLHTTFYADIPQLLGPSAVQRLDKSEHVLYASML